MKQNPRKVHFLIHTVVLLLLVAILVGVGMLCMSPRKSESLGTPFPSDFSPEQVQSNYCISTEEEFVNFVTASQSYGFAGVTISLVEDIDYTGTDFSGIGSSSVPFCGTFDGGGFTIRNLISTTSGLFQFIGSTENPATIRNLTLDNAKISGGEGRAILVSRFSGNPANVDNNNLIENVTITNSTASFSGGNCGILVGRCSADNQAITISNCTVSDSQLICTASASTNLARWGVIMGKDVSGGYSRIRNCTVTGCDIISNDCNLDQTGLVLGGSFSAIQIDGCTVIGSSITTGVASDTVTQDLGGIVGSLKSSVGVITNCNVATTSITTKGYCQHVGLLAGHIYGGTIQNNTIQSASVNAEYTSELNDPQYLGGMIGYISASKAVVENCSASRVRITTADRASYVGGLVGGIADTAAGTIFRDCDASNSYIRSEGASDTAGSALGGAIGGTLGQITGEELNAVNVTIESASPVQNAGGLVGFLSSADLSILTNSAVRLSTLTGEGAGSQIGGMIGAVSGAPAKLWKCCVENTAVQHGGLVEAIGGMVGSVEDSAAGTVIGDSSVAGLTMESTYSANTLSSRYVGGMIGLAQGYVHTTDSEVTDCSINLASLVQGLGGFAGYISGEEPSVLTQCRVENLSVTQTQGTLNDSYRCNQVSTFLGCVDSNSKLLGCTVSDSNILIQGRVYFMGGLVGSTYSDALLETPVHGQITVKNSAVTNVNLKTKQSRNCNEVGGLVGWLSEGGTVSDCFVSGVTTPSNSNATHVGGLIGYIPESTTDAVTCTVRNCYVQDCTLTAKNSLSATIGNAVATSRAFSNIHYYNCTLTGGTESNASGATQVTSGLTDGTLLSTLNTTSSWIQGEASPVLDSTKAGYSEVKVMSYNIYYLTQNTSYPIEDRQSKVIDLIDACIEDGVGVIGLQEVTKIWYSYISDYVKNRNTNIVWNGYGRYGGTFGGFSSGGSNDNGDAFSLILYDTSRYSKISEGHFWLSDTPDEKSLFYTVAFNYRVVNWVQLRDKNTGEVFFFVNAHLEETQSTAKTNNWGYTLDSSTGPVARVQQAQLICDRMAAVSNGAPVIILGDWNSYKGTDGYRTIIDAGYQDLREIAPDSHQCGGYNAWNRTDPNRFAKGDHIVVSAGCTGYTCHVLYEEDVDTDTGYHISDHCPMIATIRF